MTGRHSESCYCPYLPHHDGWHPPTVSQKQPFLPQLAFDRYSVIATRKANYNTGRRGPQLHKATESLSAHIESQACSCRGLQCCLDPGRDVQQMPRGGLQQPEIINMIRNTLSKHALANEKPRSIMTVFFPAHCLHISKLGVRLSCKHQYNPKGPDPQHSWAQWLSLLCFHSFKDAFQGCKQ